MPQKVLALFLGYIKSDIIMIHRLCRHQHILECLDVLLRGLFLFSLGLSSFHALNSRENCPILKPFFIQKALKDIKIFLVLHRVVQHNLGVGTLLLGRD